MRSQASWQPAGAPDRVQLHMGRALYDGRREVPVPRLPEGFALVQAGAAQASELAKVLGGNGELGEWDSERARRLFDDESADAEVDACFLIVIGDQAVATAQLDVHRRGRYTGLAELGWVAVLPEARGRRLGSLVSQAVLEEAETLGHRQVFLRTDDRRAPADRELPAAWLSALAGRAGRRRGAGTLPWVSWIPSPRPSARRGSKTRGSRPGPSGSASIGKL